MERRRFISTLRREVKINPKKYGLTGGVIFAESVVGAAVMSAAGALLGSKTGIGAASGAEIGAGLGAGAAAAWGTIERVIFKNDMPFRMQRRDKPPRRR